MGALFEIKGELSFVDKARILKGLKGLAFDNDGFVAAEDFERADLTLRLSASRATTVAHALSGIDSLQRLAKPAARGFIDVVDLDQDVAVRILAGGRMREITPDRPMAEGDGPIAARIRHAADVTRVVVPADGSVVAVAGYATSPRPPFENDVSLFDLHSGRLMHRLAGLAGYLETIEFSPDGSMLAGADTKGNVCLWDRDGNRLGKKRVFANGIKAVRFTGDGKRLFCSSRSSRVMTLALPAAKELIPIGLPPSEKITDVTLLPDGTLAAVSIPDCALWLGPPWRKVQSTKPFLFDCWAPSPDGSLLVMVSGRTIETFDIAAGRFGAEVKLPADCDGGNLRFIDAGRVVVWWSHYDKKDGAAVWRVGDSSITPIQVESPTDVALLPGGLLAFATGKAPALTLRPLPKA